MESTAPTAPVYDYKSTDLPQVSWHLHGHYNSYSDEKTKEACLNVFENLQIFLQHEGYRFHAVCWDQKNGPHHPGSWDIYCGNSAMGAATAWMSFKRPLNVPIFFHPVLALSGPRPTPAEELDAHSRCAIVFGMPNPLGAEHIDWANEQLDWTWVTDHWVPKSN